MFGFGVLGPTFNAVRQPSEVQIIACVAMLFGLHLVAQKLLGVLED